MNCICVFCGSSTGNNPEYYKTGKEVGRRLADRKITLVYGGAAVGIMGAVADGVLENKGQVIGVIPEFLSKKEIRHPGLTELITVQSMHQRKQKMAQLSEGFMALPGGLGTLEEVCEILTWAQLGLVPHPVGILNTKEYYGKLLALFDHMVAEGFLRPQNRDMVLHSDDIAELLDLMQNYKPLEVPKWLDSART